MRDTGYTNTINSLLSNVCSNSQQSESRHQVCKSKKRQRIAYIGTIKIPENYPPALLFQHNAPYSSLVLLLIPPTLCLSFFSARMAKEPILFSFSRCPTYSSPLENPSLNTSSNTSLTWHWKQAASFCSLSIYGWPKSKHWSPFGDKCSTLRKLQDKYIKYKKFRKPTKLMIMIILIFLMIFCISYLSYIASLG